MKLSMKREKKKRKGMEVFIPVFRNCETMS